VQTAAAWSTQEVVLRRNGIDVARIVAKGGGRR
jgi:hypothetical protein